ncbi:mCG148080 [Mus musculus]|nr:mCG148080 [Mus musculus]
MPMFRNQRPEWSVQPASSRCLASGETALGDSVSLYLPAPVNELLNFFLVCKILCEEYSPKLCA